MPYLAPNHRSTGINPRRGGMQVSAHALFLTLVTYVSWVPPLESQEPPRITYTSDDGIVACYRFDEGSGQVVKDQSGNGNHGQVEGEAKWTDGISGTGLRFNGKDTLVRIPASESLQHREELTISFWFKAIPIPLKKPTKSRVGTVVSRNWGWRCRYSAEEKSIHLAHRREGPGDLHTELNTHSSLSPGRWHHVVYSYSVSEGRFSLYVNGRKEAEIKKELTPLKDTSTKPLLLGHSPDGYNPFHGIIDEVRIYERALSLNQIPKGGLKLSAAQMLRWQNTLKQSEKKIRILGEASLAGKALSRMAKRQLVSVRKKLEELKSRGLQTTLAERNEIDFECGEELDSTIRYLNTILPQVEKSKLRDVLCYVVKPISSVMRLPDTFPVDGEISNTIQIQACRGEYEPASFVLHALENVEGLKLKASELKGDAGPIPASAVDIKVVKCWYQSGSAWHNQKQDKSKRVLVPELLLNDETLVKVDREKQENYVKLRFPEGDKYVWISNPEYDPDWEKKPQPIDEYPLRDSPVLLSVDIAQETNQQFWVTVKVPEISRAGTYSGKISLSTPTGSLGAITINLHVLPIILSKPKTNYDLNKDFICSVHTRGILNPHGKGYVNNALKTKEQYRAELNNLLAHGVTSPTMLHPDQLARRIKMRQEAGMPIDPLFICHSPAFSFEKLHPPLDQAKLNRVKKKVKEMLAVTQKFGITEVYFYGWDEREGEQLLAMKPIYRAMREAGGKTFVAGFPGQFEAVGEVLDLSNMGPRLGLDEKEAGKWHSLGHKITSYGNPQAGIENPEIYRRNYGLRLWKANFDGAMDFAHYWPYGYIWNDFDHPASRGFCFVYPTANGVIDTIAWEGYREGIDDVRYATTLRFAIKQAKNSQNQQERMKAQEAEKWLAEVDLKSADLDVVRAKMVDYVIGLEVRD